jgi:hypothetical protein
MAVSHIPCSYISVYTDVAAVLCYRYTGGGDFYSLILKTEHKLGTASGTVPPSTTEKLWVLTCSLLIQYGFQRVLLTSYDNQKPSMNYAIFYV